jgi:hypothetical protein
MFVGSQKSLLYLKQYFGERVKEVFGLSFAFEGERIDKSETLKRNLLKLPEANRQNDELFKKHFEPFEPELMVSDFEPFSAWWAWRKNVPFISIDHEHMLTLCKLDHPVKNWFSRLTASVVTECHYVGAVVYIVINFFRVPLRIDRLGRPGAADCQARRQRPGPDGGRTHSALFDHRHRPGPAAEDSRQIPRSDIHNLWLQRGPRT